MSPQPIPLEQIRIASPCQASWADMRGDDRLRFCSLCEKNVYNLSAMEPAAAQELIQRHEGSLCVRFYRRRDGTMLVDDCPVGMRSVARALTACATVFLGICLVGLTIALASKSDRRRDGPIVAWIRQFPVLQPIIDWLAPAPPPIPPPTPPLVFMGKMQQR